MEHRSPISTRHHDADAFFLFYGDQDTRAEVVETFGELEMEYAAIRKSCVLFDAPHMGAVRATGGERLAFLNNMITNKIDDLMPGASRASFWLNQKGRIDADLRLIEREDETLIRLDRHLAPRTAAALASYVFAEDCELTDASDAIHWLALHGPTSAAALGAASDDGFEPIQPGANTSIVINGVPAAVDRDDPTGEPGYWIGVAPGDAPRVYDTLAALSEDESVRLKASGWLAVNTARIEAGRPLFNIDFGTDTLPAETGLFENRVSTTKGCYLGQEVVARMHARGVRKQCIVGLRLDDQRVTMDQQRVIQPVSGSQLFERGKEGETPVGAITSSTISPMLGAIPVCFAMVRDAQTAPGTELSVWAEGDYAPCVVSESLAFWTPAPPA